MLNELSAIWARSASIGTPWAVAVIAALPILLSQLEGIDLRPILAHIIPADYVDLVVALLPFVLAIMKPMVHLEEPEDE
jgi:hypothetical protein